MRSCSGDVHFASVVVHVIVLVVDVVCLMLVLSALVVLLAVFSVSVANFLYLEVYSLHLPSVTVNCCWLLPNFHCNSASNYC